jgi:membrane associated rhomboid family serine protease
VIPLPIRDENPTVRTPWITIAIIAVNVLVWIYELTNGVDASELRLGAIPAWLVHHLQHGIVLLPNGDAVPLTQTVPWPLTIFTSMFAHGGWLHLIGNMWFLWIFGDNLEDRMGPFRYLAFYLLCGVAAAVAQTLSVPSSTIPMVGASGAIAGVMGGYLLLYPRARVKCIWILIVFITFIRVPAWLLLGLWFLSQFAIPEGSGIAWMAHVGGFVTGLLLVKLFVVYPPAEPRPAGWAAA